MAKSRSVNIYFNTLRVEPRHFPRRYTFRPPNRHVVRVISVIKTSSTMYEGYRGVGGEGRKEEEPKRENPLNWQCSVIHFIRERITSSRYSAPFIDWEGFCGHSFAVVKSNVRIYVN